MFIGHFALAFAAKRAAPRTSLGLTFIAAQLADLLWPIFLLIGIEHVQVVPASQNPFLNLEFTSYPWSHSLLMEIVYGVALGVLYYAWRRNDRGALILALLVPSHWILDFIVHIPDLPLYPHASGRFGLGLWQNPAATIIVEGLMTIVGVWIYVDSTRPRDRIGRFGLWLLVAFLVLLYAASLASPPPSSVSVLAWGALIGWPLALWPWWVDRHRDPVIKL